MPYTPYTPTWNNPYLPQVQQPQYSPAVPGVTAPYAQPVNGITKVNGRDSALQYQLPPNSMSPALFDQNGKTFYIVSTDGTGMKTVEAFDFSPHEEERPVRIDGAQFVSKQEYDQFVAKVSAALEAINGIHAAVPTAAGGQPVRVDDAGQDRDPQGPDRRGPSGHAGPAV